MNLNLNIFALSHQDKELFYKTVEAEVTGGSYEDKLRVANVILNRNNSKHFPNTVGKVIKQKGQFCVIRDGRMQKAIPTSETIRAVNDALQGKWIISSDVMYFNVKGLRSWASNNKTKWGRDNVHDFYYLY